MKIYQLFKLKRTKEKVPTLEKFLELEQRLKEKGYEILISLEREDGMPTSLIVVGLEGQPIKSDFYEIAETIEVPFISGEAYYSI